MTRVVFLLAFAATGFAAKSGDFNSWGFIFDFVEQLRNNCQTSYNDASERWATQQTTCTHETQQKRNTIDAHAATYQTELHTFELEDSKAAALANTVAQLTSEIGKSESEKATLLQQIASAEADFNSLDAEYADNIAVIQKAIEFNMDKMDAASCIPTKTATSDDACGTFSSEETCTADGLQCRWERPAALTKIQKMLNTLQDKFRTERTHAHDDYLKLVHNQQLAKLSLTQMITALSAQKVETASLRTQATEAAAEAKNAARDAQVAKDVEQESLSTKEVACSVEKETYEDAVTEHTQCQREVNEMNQLVQSSIGTRATIDRCGAKSTAAEDAADEATCVGLKEESDCNANEKCKWFSANAFVQLGMETTPKDAMAQLKRAAAKFGDEKFISLLQKAPGDVNAPDPATGPTAPDYTNWVSNIICPSITTLTTARVGCDLSTDGCDLAAQAQFHCEGRECQTTLSNDANAEGYCKDLRTVAGCTGDTSTNGCKLSEPQTCEKDLANIREEWNNLNATIDELEDEASRLSNMIATKEADVEENRGCISDANKAETECQQTVDSAAAKYESDKTNTEQLIVNAQDIIAKLNSNWSTQLDDGDSVASQFLTMLTSMQTNLQFEYAATESRMDTFSNAHNNCVRDEKTKRRVCEKQLQSLETEVAQLELDRVATVKTLANTRSVRAKTAAVETGMDHACNGAGGSIAQCSQEFSEGVEDLQNAYNILCS